MALSAGTRFGAYEIVASLGAGGMGEVYLARDSRLRREVAIKILPSTFAADRDRLARFEREARLLASLNHPNIGAIYGIEASGGSDDASSALVLEFVDGESLDARISRGALSVRDSLKIGQQIADALEAAHSQGIVHRDLKPANIRLTRSGTAKVLDFGLAKGAEAEPAGVDGSMSSTIAGPAQMTTPGILLGTPAYMSPEQARGQPVDARTDLWALGCVLYEMLAGRAAFSGSTATDVLAAIVNREPDWTRLPAAVPAPVRRVLRRCLAKDVRDRFQHAGDVRLEIEDLQTASNAAAPLEPRRQSAGRLALAAGVGALAIAAIAAAVMTFRSGAPAPEVRFETLGNGRITQYASLAISPDGRQLAVAPEFEQETPLWIRPIDSLTGRMLPGTEGAFLPFWSPDGRSIGFFAHRKLQRIDLETAVVTAIADASVGRGGAWASDGTIVFAPTVNGPLRQVMADGTVSGLTTLADGQNDHRAPQFLPGETHLLYYARGTAQARGVYVARRDGSEPKRIFDADAPAVFAPPDHLLFVRDRILYAQRFDPATRELTGSAVEIAASVSLNPGVSLATLAASAGGIAYGTSQANQYQFAWFDRGGKRITSVGPRDVAGGNPALSADGRTIAFNRVTAGNWDIWTLDLQRGALARVTSNPALEFSPVFTPDGQNIVMQSARGASADLFVKAADGSGVERLLFSSPEPKNPTDISRDGSVLIFDVSAPSTTTDVFALSMTGDSNPHAVVQTAFVEREGQLSPDGRWLAYSSNETGQFEVYVQPFPGPGPRTPVSVGGGNQLRWNRRGTELFYIDPRGRMTSVPLAFKNQSIAVGAPAALFQTPFGSASQGPRAGYVVSDDGQQFCFAAPVDASAPVSIVVMLNWRGAP